MVGGLFKNMKFKLDFLVRKSDFLWFSNIYTWFTCSVKISSSMTVYYNAALSMESKSVCHVSRLVYFPTKPLTLLMKQW